MPEAQNGLTCNAISNPLAGSRINSYSHFTVKEGKYTSPMS